MVSAMRIQLWFVGDSGFGTLAPDFVGGETQEDIANVALERVSPHYAASDFPRFVDDVGRAGYALSFVGAESAFDGWIVTEVAGEGEFFGEDV